MLPSHSAHGEGRDVLESGLSRPPTSLDAKGRRRHPDADRALESQAT